MLTPLKSSALPATGSRKVVVGLSGGVDSSVAAYLLKEEGYQVEALFMRNWHDERGLKSGACSADDDLIVARLVAKRLDIPLREIDLSREYRERVVDYMFAEYARGRTPNPDVLCNREIKFDSFLKTALARGADMVATGHYCRKETLHDDDGVRYRLLAGVDTNKDQSYFLCQLSQDQLARSLFPIGEMTKPQVRALADKLKLASAEKKDSQGICFVGKVRLPEFLQQQLEPKEGDIMEIPATDPHRESEAGGYRLVPEMGIKTGRHQGAHYFTIGQRRGLNAGGGAEARYVLGTDIERNIVYIGAGGNHPLLMRRRLSIPPEAVHWIRPDLALAAGESRRYSLRIRYRQPLQQGLVQCTAAGVRIEFDEPQRAVTPGQFAAWYEGEELVGSGMIA